MPKYNGAGIALLADPTRRRIIQLIAVHPRRPSALADEVGKSRPAMSRQLRILREAGLIRELPVPHDRRGALFGLDPDNLGRIVAWLAGTEIGVGEEMRLHPRKQSLPERLADDRALDAPVARSLRSGRWQEPAHPATGD
jgi:DNA-binding transcriptional ArsR family regulator